jgi:hypothetical protein
MGELMKATRVIGAASLVGVLIAGLGTASAASAAPAIVATQNVAGITVKNAPAFKSEDALVAYIGTTPTSVVQDMETGEIISVTGNPVSTQASTRTTCQAGDAYWAAISSPYTNACIYGSKGTVAVTPTRTNRFQTGAYHASGKWSYNNRTLSTIRQTPGSVTVIDNVATAISGTLY